jgi:hypothetical protein
MPDLKVRVCVKFCFLFGKTAVDPFTVLKEAFKEEAMGKTHVYQWFNHFKRDEMSVEDQPHCGCSSTSRTDKKVGKVHQAVVADHFWTIDEFSEITSVSWSSCQRILTADLMMKRVTANKCPVCSQRSKTAGV